MKTAQKSHVKAWNGPYADQAKSNEQLPLENTWHVSWFQRDMLMETSKPGEHAPCGLSAVINPFLCKLCR
jgi:hypothetical protein